MDLAAELVEEYVSATAAPDEPFSIGPGWLDRLTPLRPSLAGTFADVRISRWSRLVELEAPERILHAAAAFAVHTTAAQLSQQLDASGYEGSRVVLPYVGGAGRGDTRFAIRDEGRMLVSAYDVPTATAMPVDYLIEADAWNGREPSRDADEEIAEVRTAALVTLADDSVRALSGWTQVAAAALPRGFFAAVESMRPELDEAAAAYDA